MHHLPISCFHGLLASYTRRHMNSSVVHSVACSVAGLGAKQTVIASLLKIVVDIEADT